MKLVNKCDDPVYLPVTLVMLTLTIIPTPKR